MINKKIISIGFAAIFMLCVTACNETNYENQPRSSAASEPNSTSSDAPASNSGSDRVNNDNSMNQNSGM